MWQSLSKCLPILNGVTTIWEFLSVPVWYIRQTDQRAWHLFKEQLESAARWEEIANVSISWKIRGCALHNDAPRPPHLRRHSNNGWTTISKISCSVRAVLISVDFSWISCWFQLISRWFQLMSIDFSWCSIDFWGNPQKSTKHQLKSTDINWNQLEINWNQQEIQLKSTEINTAPT